MANDHSKGASAPDQPQALNAVPDDFVHRYVADRAIARLRVIDDVIALHTGERCVNTDELDEVGYMLREVQHWLQDAEALDE